MRCRLQQIAEDAEGPLTGAGDTDNRGGGGIAKDRVDAKIVAGRNRNRDRGAGEGRTNQQMKTVHKTASAKRFMDGGNAELDERAGDRRCRSDWVSGGRHVVPPGGG